jgi:hypothetical protein
MANLTYTVQNKNGSYDGDMVVKQYTSMTINAGDTVTTDQPCRGLLIYVQGNCTINGTLSMKGRGALANPTISGASDSNAVDANGLRLPFLTTSGTDTLSAASTLFNGCGTTARTVVANQKSISSNGTIMQITRTGGVGNGFASGSYGTTYVKLNGITGGTLSNGTGGGGSGSIGYAANNSNSICYGTDGTCFSGGSGGGGANFGVLNGSSYNFCSAYSYGGAGGFGRSGHTARCTGGAGNPNGSENAENGYGGGVNVSNNETGTGGIIWLIVGGNLTIGSTGLITVQGSRSDSLDGNGYEWMTTGGGSGAGAIRIAHRGTFTNNGTINYSGGQAGTFFDAGGEAACATGGNGGAGSLQTLQIN